MGLDKLTDEELDGCVAVEVMGWRLEIIDRSETWVDNDGKKHRGPEKDVDKLGWPAWINPWQPSTSIADAMKDVVPAVLRRGEACPEFTLYCEWWLTDKKPVWFASFEMVPGGASIEARADGEDAAPHAICLAALKAVGATDA